MNCKSCNRALVDNKMVTKNGCIWCDTEFNIRQNESHTVSKEPVITLRTMDEKIISIPVNSIHDVKLSPVEVTIKTDKVRSFHKRDYYYPHWRYFIKQLVIRFNVQELQIV